MTSENTEYGKRLEGLRHNLTEACRVYQLARAVESQAASHRIDSFQAQERARAALALAIEEGQK